MVMVFLAITNYLIDSYTIFAASVLAANSLLRSLFGFAFPLFTTYMFQNLGIHWASSIPAFLALGCVPFPFLFFKYGAQIRAKCVYAAQSDAVMRKLIAQRQQQQQLGASGKVGERVEDKEADTPATRASEEATGSTQQQTANVTASEEERDEARGLERVKTAKSTKSIRSVRSRAEAADYQVGPYDLDLVNTHTSISGLGTK